MNKKNYVAPSVEVVEMDVQESLLAGSGEQNGSIENGYTSGFDSEWD